MDLEAQVKAAILAELDRQSADAEGALKVAQRLPGGVEINGVVDLEALSMVVVGSVAGGP